MKICVDRELCMNSGMCTQTAPDIFGMDEEGALIILKEEVPEEHILAVEDAAACCPVSALQLTGA